MNTDVSAYGLWPLVVVNAAVIIIFAFSFTHPSTGRDWRSFAHGMRNEIAANKLNYVDDLHKLFHHAC